MKIAVLTTSDIQSNWKLVSSWLKNPDQPVVGTIEDNYGEIHSYGSWGKLEQALAEGYTVYVVTSRHIFGSHDQWWRELVGDDNIIQTRISDDHHDIQRGGASDPVTMAGWKTFIREDLGLEPNSEAGSWMELLESLHEHGVKTGRDFRKEPAGYNCEGWEGCSDPRCINDRHGKQEKPVNHQAIDRGKKREPGPFIQRRVKGRRFLETK